MTERPVLVYVLDRPTGLVAVHLPPLGLVPPEPDTWGDVADLRAWCGAPPRDPSAFYGERAIIEDHDIRGELTVLWCALCFPGGPLAG